MNKSAPTSPTVRIGSAICHAMTEQEVIAYILSELNHVRGGWIVTHNLDHVRRLECDAKFRNLCADANLRVADGMPLIWASHILGERLPERVAGSNLILSLSAKAAEARKSIFLLGGNPGAADRAGEILTRRYPGLRVAGCACPSVGFENDPDCLLNLQTLLRESKPDIVYIALGSPKQEYLAKRLVPLLPSTWFLGVGISFSFVCGEIVRAPLWMQHLGLEWMHRLAQEPGRLVKRYLIQGLPFAVRLLFGALVRRICDRDDDMTRNACPSSESEFNHSQ